MAEKENFKKEFKTGQTINCLLSEIIHKLAVNECSAYIRKTEEDKWEIFGICNIIYDSIDEDDGEGYAFCAKIAPKISNAIFRSIYEQKETPIDFTNYSEYFCYHNTFYFFPIDGFYIHQKDKKFECGFMSYVGIFFEIEEDCKVEIKRIPLSEYEEIDDAFPYDEDNKRQK